MVSGARTGQPIFRSVLRTGNARLQLFAADGAAVRASLSGWIAPHARPGASGGTADALASGASVRKDVGVQIPPRAPCDVARHTGRLEPLTRLWPRVAEASALVIHG